MSKERLEEIKNRRKNYRPDLLPIWFEDMDYLIERVQELEEQHRDEFEKVNFLFKRNNERRNKINDLEQQNKRYREALEFINEELELVLHSNKGLAEKMFYIENSKRKITEVLESESE